MTHLLNRPLIVASGSPRRQYLMQEAGFAFSVKLSNAEEDFPAEMTAEQVAPFLAKKKADFFIDRIQNEIVLTADTVVILDGKILNKPAHKDEAVDMLRRLSGKTHVVITGVHIYSIEKHRAFHERTDVTFKKLDDDEIRYYVEHFKPFDKAGSYGAQECLPPGLNPCSVQEMKFLKKIGNEKLIEKITAEAAPQGAVTAVKKIEGSFFNVMGLPLVRVYEELLSW